MASSDAEFREPASFRSKMRTGDDVEAAKAVDLEDIDAGGKNPLMNASFFGRTESVKVLLDRGARLLDPATLVDNPLALNGHYSALLMFERLGVDPATRAAQP